MLGERRGSLRRLTLRACDLTEHDPDVPLIFDLRPLAQVTTALCSMTKVMTMMIVQSLSALHAWISAWTNAGGHKQPGAIPPNLLP